MGRFKPQDFQIRNGNVVYIRNLEVVDEAVLWDFYAKAAKETQHTLVCQEKLHSMSRLREKIENVEKSHSEMYIGVFDDAKIIGSLQFVFVGKNMHMKMYGMSEGQFDNYTETHKNHVIGMVTSYLFQSA